MNCILDDACLVKNVAELHVRIDFRSSYRGQKFLCLIEIQQVSHADSIHYIHHVAEQQCDGTGVRRNS